MCITISLQSRIPANEIARKSLPLCAKAVAAAVIPMLLLFAFQPLAAQTSVSSPKSPAGQKPVHHRARPSAAHRIAAQTEAAATPITPPAPPPPPDWPANDKPSPASIGWDSQGLRIEAQNSSLKQIMSDVSTATGAKVEGLDTDQRVFGIYGPGRARDVLSQLLQGSGYNVMMIGDQGQGTPRQILLSLRQRGETHPAAAGNQASAADEDTEAEEPQPQQTPSIPNRPVVPSPGLAPRTPQQIMQEMQRRQQQMQQRQQQDQQPANPQN
jgi:hypothetical protein